MSLIGTCYGLNCTREDMMNSNAPKETKKEKKVYDIDGYEVLILSEFQCEGVTKYVIRPKYEFDGEECLGLEHIVQNVFFDKPPTKKLYQE